MAGAALYLWSCTVSLTSCKFEDNTATDAANAIYISGGVTVNLTNMFVNYTEGVGASTQVEDGVLDYPHKSGSNCLAGNYGNCEKVVSTWSCPSDTCNPCPPGKYSNAGAGAESECWYCEIGRFSNKSATKSCSVCGAGSYASTDATDTDGDGVLSGATFCMLCPQGKYQPDELSYLCSDCTSGKSSARGSTNCTACGSGKYASSTGSSECVDCDSGKKANRPNAATGCEKCTAPKSSFAGKTNCSICVENYFLNTDGKCKPCPGNANCKLGTVLTNIDVSPRYWRVNTQSTTIRECTSTRAACKGGNSSLYCQYHSHGPYCAACDKGYWRAFGAERCKSCYIRTDIGKYVIHICIAVGISICIIMGVLVRKFMHQYYEDKIDAINIWYIELKAKLKILVVFEQVASRFPQMLTTIKYPYLYIRFSHIISEIFSFQFLVSVVPFECLHDSKKDHFYHVLFVKTAGPIIVVALGALCYAAKRYWLKMQCTDVAEFERHKKILHGKFMEALLVFTYVVFVPSSMVAFAFFNCDKLSNSSAYLRIDYSTECYTNRWTLYLIYAVAMILVFPIGIPLTYYVCLWQKRHLIDPIVPSTGKRGRMAEDLENTLAAIALRKKDETLVPLAFLFESYEPAFWWWECFVCLNRLLLTNVDVVLSHAPKLQLIFILTIVLIDLEVTSNFAPYIDDTDDVFADVAQWCVITILIFSIALEVGAIRPESSGVGLLFVLLLFVTIIAFVGYGIDYAWEEVRDVPKHLLSVKSRVSKTSSLVNSGMKFGRRTGGSILKTLLKTRSAEAGLDPTRANDEYFPELRRNETNTINVYEEEISIIEEESVQESVPKSVQAPNQKPTDYSGYPCLDSPVSEYGLDISWDTDSNLPCAIFKQSSGN